MRVLSVTSECVPLVKTGGLADVAGALPGALAGQGIDMRTLLPGYPDVLKANAKAKQVLELPGFFGGKACIRQGELGETGLYILDAPHLFDRPGSIYLGPDGKDWPDNPERYAALCKAAALIAAGKLKGWTPQALHLHDWQAGLTPIYLREMEVTTPTLLTIHNIAFQGLAPKAKLAALGLPKAGFDRDGFEYWDQISALKAGLVYATRINTVSPSYARELLTPEFGMGMEGVLASRGGDFTGILNGIDLDVWAPPYKSARGKARHKKALRREFGLPDWDGPLTVVISRLTGQKGLDLLLEALPALLDNGGQLALLGSGDAALEAAFLDKAEAHPGVAVRIGYDEALSRRMIAGADAILVPSRFEPCGLTQLYGLRFGTLPLVAATGGLADTVIDANPAAIARGVATGVQFHPVTTQALAQALLHLTRLYAQPDLWSKMQRNAMAQPVGWDASAAAYGDLIRAMTAA